MNLLTEDQNEMGAEAGDLLRDACEQGLAEPARIWDLLEARGIHVTPGVVYQVIGNLNKLQATADHESAATAPSDRARGLTPEDVEAVASLAEKAGGVEQLVRLLGAMQHLPRR